MSNSLRPLAAALGITLTIAAGGAAVAMGRHQNHRHAPPPAWSGSLITLSPDPPPTPAPWSPPIVHPAIGVDLIWTTVPGHDQLLAAHDWSGTVRGSFTLPAPRAQIGKIAPSPDGQRLLISMPDDTLHVFTAQGVDLGRVAADGGWAGDDTHVCSLSNNQANTSATLSVAALGTAARPVTTLHWSAGDAGAQLAACNVISDLAVIVVSLGDDNAGHVVELRVVHLSSGTTLRDVHPSDTGTRGALATVTSSADGKLLLLMPWSDDPAEHPLDWQVADSVSGRVLAHITASDVQLIGDGRWLLTDEHFLDWRTHAAVPASPRCCGILAAEPGGDGIAAGIASGPPPTPVPPGATGSEPPPPDLVILSPNGVVVPLACCGATLA